MRLLAGVTSSHRSILFCVTLLVLVPAIFAASPTRQNRATVPGTVLTSSPPAEVPIPAGVGRGWPVDLNPPAEAFPYTPSLIDVDQDGALEVVVTGQETFALKGDGTFLPGWPTTELPLGMTYGTNDQKPGPSGADVDGDGQVEVMWSLRDYGDLIWCYNGRDANGQNMPGYPQHALGNAPEAYLVPFVLGDSDGDGLMEAWGAHSPSWDSFTMNRLAAYDHLGNCLFDRSFDLTENILDLYFGDLDGDAQDEFFAVTDSSSIVKLYAFRPDGSSPGFPVVLESLDPGADVAWGVPIPVDLDGDGDLEILVAYSDGASYSFVDARHHDGAPVPGFPIPLGSDSQALAISLGDLTGDGRPELIATEFYCPFHVFAFDLSTGASLPGWPLVVQSWPHGLPIVADVDGDGLQDVCFSDEVGGVYAFNAEGGLVPGFPKTMHYGSISGVAVGDIDGDGLHEIVCSTWDGWVYAWDTTAPALPGRADWPTRGIDPRNTGVFRSLNPAAVSSSFPVGPRLRISPSPVSSAAEFVLSSPGDATGITLLDAAGRCVDRVALRGGRAQWRPAAALPPGVYFVRTEGGHGVLGARLVRVR